VAVMLIGKTPSVVGVPDTTPPRLIVTPEGAPAIENVAAGFADAVTT